MVIYAIQQVSINANNVHTYRYMSFYDSKDKVEKALKVVEAEERATWSDCPTVEIVHSDDHSFIVDYYHDDRKEKINERKIYHIVNVEVH